MRSLNALLMLLGALSVLLLGAVPASATAGDRGMPPCHEQAAMSRGHQQAPANTEAPDTAMATMACCISGVVVATTPRPPVRGPVVLVDRPVAQAPASLPVGLSLKPEHGPPKT